WRCGMDAIQLAAALAAVVLEASLGIGVASFAGPFVVASLVAFFLLDWTVRASLIAGTALSTTSLAVVYAVLVERGLTDTAIGKLLMSAVVLPALRGPRDRAGDQARVRVPARPDDPRRGVQRPRRPARVRARARH